MNLDEAFQSTFKLIFGECNVTMEELAPYLVRGHYQVAQQCKSALSGREVVVSTSRYPEDARYISQDEIDYAKKPSALSLNDIKDIDSIVSAFGERFAYAGNKVFGNSAFVEASDNCTDSFYVYRSHTVVNSKYVGYSSYVRDGSECVFGSNVFLNGKHVIRFLGGHNVSRIFESCVVLNSSDMFFCLYCLGCSDCMFCFNQRNRRHCIGNAELARDRYAALKKKLVDESREYIEKHKSFHSIFDFPPPTKEEIAAIGVPAQPRENADLAPVEAGFEAATKLVLGVPLSPIKKYEKFLTGRVEGIGKAKSPFGNDVFHSRYFWAANAPKERMITSEEGMEAAKARIKESELEGADLERLLAALSAIAFYPVQFREGNNRNNSECPIMYHSTDCYRISDATYSKKCAYDIHATNCEAVFGSGILMTDSSFSLRCHDCVKVGACMDMDSCKNCFRCLFCHNCEGLSDCMFCFNAKNLKYAIGNAELGREKFMEMKKKVLEWLVAELEEKKGLRYGIYNIGKG